MATKDDIIGIIESRYDYYSAQVLFKGALKDAGLGDKKDFSAEETASFAAALKAYDTTAEPLAVQVEELAGGAKPAPKQEEKKEEPKKEEPKKEEKKEEKKDDKKDDKKDSKGKGKKK